MLSGLIYLLFALICIPAAKTAFMKKDKVSGLFFSIFGVAFLAGAINSGIIALIWNAFLGFLIAVKNIIIFLIAGWIHIPMIILYIIIFVSFVLGFFIAAACSAAKKSDKRARVLDAHTVDTINMARKMRERDK